jgi:hypothetical protein
MENPEKVVFENETQKWSYNSVPPYAVWHSVGLGTGTLGFTFTRIEEQVEDLCFVCVGQIAVCASQREQGIVIAQLDSRIRTCRRGTNLLVAQPCTALSESVEDVAKVREPPGKSVQSIREQYGGVREYQNSLHAKQFLLLSLRE